jgi:mono/diheme cytochrome c family protein
MKRFSVTHFSLLIVASIMISCGRGPSDPGTEYSPQMYISKAYEPYSQAEVEPDKVDYNKFNPMGINMRIPPKNTVARRRFNTNFEIKDSTGSVNKRDLMLYNIHRDSIQIAERVLKNPFPASPEVMKEGEVLYLRYCSPCHGANGDGKGKVGDQYKGVPNYSQGVYKTMNSGHIFHVITHGRNRMWPHASLLNVDERWKVVHYVHKLQGNTGEGEQAKADSTQNAK